MQKGKLTSLCTVVIIIIMIIRLEITRETEQRIKEEEE